MDTCTGYAVLAATCSQRDAKHPCSAKRARNCLVPVPHREAEANAHGLHHRPRQQRRRHIQAGAAKERVDHRIKRLWKPRKVRPYQRLEHRLPVEQARTARASGSSSGCFCVPRAPGRCTRAIQYACCLHAQARGPSSGSTSAAGAYRPSCPALLGPDQPSSELCVLLP